jgi:hypothetical protein
MPSLKMAGWNPCVPWAIKTASASWVVAARIAARVITQRLGVKRIDPRLIHEGAIGGADLDRVGIVRLAGRDRLDDSTRAVLAQYRQHGEIAKAGAVRRDFRPVIPRAVGIAIEVIPGLYRQVAAREVDPPGAIFGGDRRSADAGGRI